eukprot:gene46005-57355_t
MSPSVDGGSGVGWNGGGIGGSTDGTGVVWSQRAVVEDVTRKQFTVLVVMAETQRQQERVGPGIPTLAAAEQFQIANLGVLDRVLESLGLWVKEVVSSTDLLEVEPPTPIPTRVPTITPTVVPTPIPTRPPTMTPTVVPTVVPSIIPTVIPTPIPT